MKQALMSGAVRVCSIPDPSASSFVVGVDSGNQAGRIADLQAQLATQIEARGVAEQALGEKDRSLEASNRALEKVARSLDEQRLQLNSILDHAAAGIFLAGQDQVIVSVNNAGRLMFGIADDDAVFGMSVLDLFVDPDPVRQVFERVRDGRGGDMCEAGGQRIDGSVFPVEFAANAFLTSSGASQSVWIIRDITSRKDAEARNAALRRELATAQKLEALGTLASGVAHEINTPVQYVGDNLRFLDGAVRCLCELVNSYQGNASAEAIEALRQRIDADFLMQEIPGSISQSQHGLSEVARIVGAIREYSHPGGGPTTQVSVNDIVVNALSLSRNVWKNVAEVSFDADQSNPVVDANAGDLSQVLVNMIVNSTFAIEKRQLPSRGRISIFTRVRDGNIEIEIDDDGGGVEEEIAERIFDPFFTTKDRGEGSGQGLAISHNIIHKKHNGRIVCSNRPGEGVSFTIVLPPSGNHNKIDSD